MPYKEEIELRIAKSVSDWENHARKKMFGGICHLLNGNMFCGVYKEFLILRLGRPGAETAMKRPHVRPFDITGKPMKGWVMVAEKGYQGEKNLSNWLEKAKKFAKTLPSK